MMVWRDELERFQRLAHNQSDARSNRAPATNFMADDLTFDEAMTQECPHGLKKIIVCPKCNPEKYVLSPKELKRLQEIFKDYAISDS